MKQQENPRTI